MSGWGAIFNSTSYALSTHSQLLAKLQQQAASGARIIRVSDEPSDAYRILGLRNQGASTTSYLRNLEDLTRNLTVASDVMQSISESLARTRQLVTQAASGTYRPEQRMPMGREVEALLEQIISSVNGQSLGRYLFGGSKTGQTPYTVQRSSGEISGVTYQGSRENLLVPVAPGVDYASMLVGEDVFRSSARGTPEFLGNTGIRAGTMTSNVSGDAWLNIIHDTTAYAGLLGLSAGAGSTEGDTILGLHTITVDAAAQTIRLDDGSPVHFNLGDTNVLVTNAAGDKVYVNAAGWTGSSGAEAINASGWMTLDDGLSYTEVTFSDNQALTDSRTGTRLYVNTSGVSRSGTEPIRVSGTYDLFSAMIHIRDLLLNKRNLNDAEQVRLLSEAVSAISEVSAGLSKAITSVGSRLGAMDNLKASLENVKTHADDQAAMLQDADIVQVATQLARTQTLYEMTLASSAKLLNLSLLNYI